MQFVRLAFPFFLLASTAAYAQTQLSLPSQVLIRPGASFEAPLSFADTTGRIAGLQWELPLPPGWSASATAGPDLAAPAKTLACNPAATLCLIYGLNRHTLQPGVVARYSVTVAPGTAPGAYSIGLGGVLGGDEAGRAMPVSGNAIAVKVLARHDIDGDGVTGAADLQLMVDQILGRSACSADQNGDNKCDLLDALLVIIGSYAG